MLEQELQKQENQETPEKQETANETAAEIKPEFTENQGNVSADAGVAAAPQTDAATIEPEPELFGRYEIKNWNFTPRIYKITAAAAVFNLFVLFVFAQGNLLTTRGCDSPMVSKVCQVLDTVYLTSTLLGTDAEWSNDPYKKTEIGESDEIIYRDVTVVSPPLKYPEGYFALANPEQFQTQFDPMNPTAVDANGNPIFEMPPTGSIAFPGGTTSSGATNMMNNQPVFPNPNEGGVIGNLPGSTSGTNPIASTPSTRRPPRMPRMPRPGKTPPNESPGKLPDLGGQTAKTDPEPEPEPKPADLTTMPPADKAIKKQALQDFGQEVLKKLDAKSIDLNKDFKVILRGTITEDGSFDPQKTKFDKLNNQEGDTAMAKTAQEALNAIGNSQILIYLKTLGVENIVFELAQNDKEIYAVITSDLKSSSKAKTISSGLNGYIMAGKLTVKEADTLMLLNAAKVEPKGNNLVLNFNLQKPIAQELINRQIIKAQAKRKELERQGQPSSEAEVKPNQNTAVK